MSKRSKNAKRCARCRMHEARCLCAHIPQLTLEARLVLVMHRRELPKPTATGPLALAALTHSELYIHGREHAPLDLHHLQEEGRRVLLLFPSEDAVPLPLALEEDDSRPITLVVPDGNWRQASRIPKRVAGLEQVKRVTLPPGEPSRWGIRRETREDGLATFEAIARAFGMLESSAVQTQLETLFDRMVQATLAARGNQEERPT